MEVHTNALLLRVNLEALMVRLTVQRRRYVYTNDLTKEMELN